MKTLGMQGTLAPRNTVEGHGIGASIDRAGTPRQGGKKAGCSCGKEQRWPEEGKYKKREAMSVAGKDNIKKEPAEARKTEGLEGTKRFARY